MQKVAQAYRQTQVTTTSQGDILLMLYDGAINFLNTAKQCLAADDMAGKGNYISKTLDVLNELSSTLNMEKGGSLSANLNGLYLFCSRQLVQANLKKSPALIDEVLRILVALRDAFAQIVDMPEAKAAGEQAAASQRVAAMPTRAQAGVASAGIPAPGANARMRAIYAQRAAELEQVLLEQADAGSSAEETPAARETAPPLAPAPAIPSFAAALAGMKKPAAPAAFAYPPAPQAGFGRALSAPLAAQAAASPEPVPLGQTGTENTGGFAGANAQAANMYRRFAGLPGNG